MSTVRLRILLVTLLALLTVLLTVVVMWAYGTNVKKQNVENLANLGRAVSSSASGIIIDAIIEEDYAQLMEVSMGYANTPLILTAWITDAHGSILADSSGSSLGKVLADYPFTGAGQQKGELVVTRQHDQTLLLYRGLNFEGELFGSVTLEISQKPMLAYLRQVQTNILLAGITFCCFCFAGSWFLGLWLIRPLEQITAKAEAISREETAPALKPSVIREIQYLAKAFLRMEQKVAKREKSLKESAEVLRAERERLAVTLSSIGDGVISTDKSGRIELVNRAAEEMTGWRAQEAEKRPLEEVFCLVPSEEKGALGEIAELELLTTCKFGKQIDCLSLESRTGGRLTITGSSAPIRDKNGTTIGAVLVFRDVTELQKLEQDRLKVKQLESLGTLAGGIAHDFNNILAAILGNISLGLLQPALDKNLLSCLDGAEKACLRAKGLTSQLLTFAKGGAPVKESASIAEIVKESADFVLHGSNVSCTYQVDDNLWRAQVDKGQISQVVQNLVINADQAMTEGGTIIISCSNRFVEEIDEEFDKQHSRYVQIKVRDTGSGISAVALEKIFNPYFSTKKEGSGLGLSVCHSILSKHNGSISVRSTPGKGTTFTLYIPVTGPQYLEKGGESEILHRQERKKILLMDDEEVVRNLGRKMLEFLGHEVVLACSGQEAVSLFADAQNSGDPIDISIIDLTIPGGMGGRDAASKILALDSNAKLIVSSGFSNDPIMADYQSYGFAAAIPKPYRIQDMAKGVERV